MAEPVELPPAASPPPARRRLPFAGAAAAAAVVIAAIVLWWWSRPSAPPPLEPDWEAVVTTRAGALGEGVIDGEPWAARLSDPFGIAIDTDGAIYISDAGDAQRLRRVLANGRVETYAGGARGFADGDRNAARFDAPSALAIDRQGALYVADTGNHAIRRIARDGVVTTLAGDGVPGDADGSDARFNGPVGIAIDPHGRVIVADTYNDRIRAIGGDGVVSTIAGGTIAGYQDGPAAQALFDTPCGVAVDAAGNIYVADTGNGAIRKIDPAGAVTTILQDLEGTPVRPLGVAVSPEGVLYATDERGRLLELRPDGGSRTVAGLAPGYADGGAGRARLRRPAGIAVAGPGRLMVADTGNAAVREITARALTRAQPPWTAGAAPQFAIDAFARAPLLWPVSPMEGPHEIAGTLGEARGAAGAERFHAGIDIRVDEGTLVRAIRDGVVSSPVSSGEFGTLNEWLRVGPITYVHVRAGRARDGEVLAPGVVPSYDMEGKLARVRVRRGTIVRAGDTIASANSFNHVHLNVGWPGEEVNPLTFRIPSFRDTVAPTIAAGGVHLYTEDWQPLPRRGRRPVAVSGRLRIVVDAWDQVDGNRPGRRLGLYSLGYQVLETGNSPAAGFESPSETLVFDRLAVQPDAARIVYAPGSGIPFYGGRRTRFLYVVTSTLRNGIATDGVWDSSQLPPGRYTIRVHARDISGNEATANRDIAITVAER